MRYRRLIRAFVARICDKDTFVVLRIFFGRFSWISESFVYFRWSNRKVAIIVNRLTFATIRDEADVSRCVVRGGEVGGKLDEPSGVADVSLGEVDGGVSGGGGGNLDVSRGVVGAVVGGWVAAATTIIFLHSSV